MKIFYVIAFLWLLALLTGDSASDVDESVRSSTFLLLSFIVFAVFALGQRINRAVKQVQDPDFDVAAENRKEWKEVGEIFLIVLAILVLGTAGQGVVRCLADDGPLSTSCVWQGILEQIIDDFN